MEFRKIVVLAGPNIWARFPVLEAWVELGDLKDSPSDSIPGFNDRLMAWLPGMIEHRCSVGERGGFFQRLRDGTYPAHILEHISLELQGLLGIEVGYGRARETSQEGLFRVALAYEDESVARACLETGRQLFLAAVYDRPFDVAAEVKRLQLLARKVRIGPSTRAMVNAATARGIPVRRLSDTQMLIQLGHGAKQHRINRSSTDNTRSVAEAISDDKEVTKAYLRSAGIPVPRGRVATSPTDAWTAAQEIGGLVVVKPAASNYGQGVVIGISQQAAVEAAYDEAIKFSDQVLVEQFVLGMEHRLLVIDGKFMAATRGIPAHVTGDGKHTLAELVESQLNSDPRRGDGPSFPLAKVVFDITVVLMLEQEGYRPDSIPAAGTQVIIQRNGNLAYDETDEVHPQVARTAELAARVLCLDVAGIDVIADDLGRPLAEQGGVILEVNSMPGLAAHVAPETGQPRPVGEAILGTIFPAGENGRIPLVSVTGAKHTGEVTQRIARMLAASGRVVGLADAREISIGGKKIAVGDFRGPQGPKTVLLNPLVEAAVFETSLDSIVNAGVGFDACSLAVVTSIGPDGYKLDFAEWDTAHKSTLAHRGVSDIVLPTGTLVLRAGEPLGPLLVKHCPGELLLFALDEQEPELVAHRAGGGKVVFARGDKIVRASGKTEHATTSLPSEAPDEATLAAAAAAWALGLKPEAIVPAVGSLASSL